MTATIPAPAAVRPVDAHVDLAGPLRPDVPDELAGVWTWFAERCTLLVPRREVDPATVRLRVDPAVGADVVVHGVRADGADPRREAYRLSVSAAGASVVGASVEGVFRGLTTLLHELAVGGGRVRCQTVTDAPLLAWRGLSLDVARGYVAVATLQRVVDLLAHYKMNVLHLHLTDSEGWRAEVPGHPELTGAEPGGWYSTADLTGLVGYARARQVTVVPELDAPGHVATLLRACPWLADETVRALPPGLQYLDPDRPGVADLLRDAYAAFAAASPGARLHVGGDEAAGMPPEAFARFMALALPLARAAAGAGVVAWQETARSGAFAPGDVCQWWVSPLLAERAAGTEDLAALEPERRAFVEMLRHAPGDVPAALAQGASVLVSRCDLLYLDTCYPEPSVDVGQPGRVARLGLPPDDYGNGTVAEAYAWDPLDAGVPADRVAGVEAAMWGPALLDPDDLFVMLLPRLPGIAEKGWSGSRTWPGYADRLRAQAPVWDALGWDWYRSTVVWG